MTQMLPSRKLLLCIITLTLIRQIGSAPSLSRTEDLQDTVPNKAARAVDVCSYACPHFQPC